MAEHPEPSSLADASLSQAPSLDVPALTEQIEYVRGLAQVVADEGLSELEVESDGLKITLRAPELPVQTVVMAPMTAGVAVASPTNAAPAPKATAAKAKSTETFTPLVSPMVGVYYRAPSPNDSNFVEVGDRVERGQTVGLIEAMKVFNEITAEHGGVVAEILVQNGALIETGQPLILLK